MNTKKLNNGCKYYALNVNAPKERGLTRRTMRKADAVTMYTMPSYDVNGDITDTAAAYMMERAQWAVYHVLSTIYNRTAVQMVNEYDAYASSIVHKYGMRGGASRKLKSLLNEWFELYATDTAEFIEWKQRTAEKTVQRDGEKVKVPCDYSTMRTVHHVKQFDKRLNRYVPIIPYDTLEFTEAGAELLREIQPRENVTAEDLVQDAFLAILELVRAGAIVDWHDIGLNIMHVNRAVSRSIYSERKADGTESIDYMIQSGADGELNTVYGARNIERVLNGIQIPMDMLIDAIGELMAEDAKKTFDIDSAKRALRLYVDGYTMRDAAAIMGKDFKQVKRWIAKARNLVYTRPVELAEILA